MKTIRFISIAIFSLLFSCTKENVSTETVTDKVINKWIYQQMKDNYYWTDKMPAEDALAQLQKPDEYFYSLIHQKDVVDRFSWIEESATDLKNSFQGITKSYGYKFGAFIKPNTTDKIILTVRYPVKNGPAERAGLKRGDIITKINGTELTTSNWIDLAYPDQPTSQTLTLATIANKVVTEKTGAITIVAEEVTENPLYLSTVITKGNKKIGYLVYNQFISSYDTQLRNAFTEFKTAGVNELIIDLRYNGGGFVSSARTFASLIGKNVKSTDVFCRYEYNPTIAANLKKANGDGYDLYKFANESNNIGANLTRVVFIVSKSSASASEMLVNALKPFMTVVLVGDNTYGKNVGSYTIEDTQSPKRWNWGLQPITFKTYNQAGQSDYGSVNGFTPDIAQKETILPYAEFGSESETLLAKALAYITGATTTQARMGLLEGQQMVSEPLKASPVRFNMWATKPTF